MVYTFTAYIDLDPDPGRVVAATAIKRFDNSNEAQIFARGFAWQVYQEHQQPVDVAFRAAGSEFTSWAFYPIF